MSAMSASSPPAGLMPLRGIVDHKTGVPPPAVQPLSRTPEKLPAPTEPQVPVPQPLPAQPLNFLPTKPTLPVSVANGMEIPMPMPSACPLQPVELAHPTGPSAPAPLPPPPPHLPNLPCGGKGEVDGPASLPPLPALRMDTNREEPPSGASGGVKESGTAAEAPPTSSNQPPTGASVLVSPMVSSSPPKPSLPLVFPPVPAASQPHAPPPVQPATQEASLPQQNDAGSAPEPAPIEEVPPVAEKPPTPSPPVQPPSVQRSEPSPAPLPPTPAPAVLPSATLPSPKDQSPPEPPKPKPKRAPKVASTSADKDSKTTASEPDDEKEENDKPKRKRLPTQPYQCPIPELNIIAKISKIDKAPNKKDEERLILFYKNEFLAVRNAEGSYYVCQAMQNIYKGSSKIRIRWLSQESNGQLYTPDFYDHTEFDCILTNLNLQRVGKDKFKLPEVESQRTESILKRAIDVEKGVAVPDDSALTEEHPDGLDLSLYRNEDQLKKRKKSKRKKAHPAVKKDETKKENPTRKLKKRLKPEVAAKKSTVTGRRGAVKRKASPAPSQTSLPATNSRKPVRGATTSKDKKPAVQPAPQVKPSGKRRASRTTYIAQPVPEKKPRRDSNVKTKSGASGSAPASTRRTLRTPK